MIRRRWSDGQDAYGGGDDDEVDPQDMEEFDVDLEYEDENGEDWNEEELPEMMEPDFEEGPEWADDGRVWGADVDELPELIFTAAEDSDGGSGNECDAPYPTSDILRTSQMALSRSGGTGVSEEFEGDVDAVRIVLLGMSDSGRPSVGIDLGYAYTGEHHTEDGASRRSLQDAGGSRRNGTTSSPAGQSWRGAGDQGRQTQQSSPSTVNSNNNNNNNIPASPHGARVRSERSSPFVFRAPSTPSRNSRPIVFSEHAANNTQTFLFEGTPGHSDAATPAKFVATSGVKAIMNDDAFVFSVLATLPGVDMSDPRILKFKMDECVSSVTAGVTSSLSALSLLTRPDRIDVTASSAPTHPLTPNRPSSARDLMVKPMLRPSSGRGISTSIHQSPSLTSRPLSASAVRSDENEDFDNSRRSGEQEDGSSSASTPFKPSLALASATTKTPTATREKKDVDVSEGGGHVSLNLVRPPSRPSSARRPSLSRPASVLALIPPGNSES